MEKSRIEKQFDFIKEIDKEKFIMAYGDNDRYAFRICKFGN